MDHILKDRLLSFFNENPTVFIGSNQLSTQLEMNEQDLLRSIELINGEMGETIKVWPGYSNDLNELSLNNTIKARLAKFLHDGGFTGEFDRSQIEIAEESEIRTLYKENLRLSNQAKLDAQSSAESAKQSQRWTMIMTIITALATVVSVIIAWKALK